MSETNQLQMKVQTINFDSNYMIQKETVGILHWQYHDI